MSNDPSNSELLTCAVAVARAAGFHAFSNWSRRKEVLKVAPHDIKLQLDVESQHRAEEVVRSRFPDHAFLGEEETGHADRNPANAKYLWIIDPIDGTVNFSHGIPFWCTSVAVEREGQTLAGAVFAPALDHLFTATSDKPALFNGKPVKVSNTSQLTDAMIATGIDRGDDIGIPPMAIFNRITATIQKARVFGSAALDLCRVASGHIDGYFEAGIYVWDVAAAGLIVRQAGGKAEELGRRQGHCIRFVASNGIIHEDLKKVVDVTTFK